MPRHGFARVAAAVPHLRVADTRYNAARTIDLLHRAADQAVDVVVFPEVGLTGYTCNDLFSRRPVQEGPVDGPQGGARPAPRLFGGLAVVGVPLVVDDQVYNC